MPDQGVIVPFITKGVRGLKVESVRSLAIYGRITGEDLPAWRDRVDLGELPQAVEVEPGVTPIISDDPRKKPIALMPATKKGKTVAIVLGVIASGVVLGLVNTLKPFQSVLTQPRSSASTTAASPPSKKADGWFRTKEGYVAALSEEDLEQVIGYAASKDSQAFQSAITNGKAVLLRAGIRVHLEKCLGFACNKVKVRPEGQSQEVYTMREAIEED
ncbi:hypothetical protein H6F43_03265 [Leptolyngbya sp. FACHB-36]|uniref:hypothetical protein n=1 Tax=Leptolyngbya sp. FACHB-36 TaxID=2692808 RepID=UPI0016806EA1|nr:hypothetical protein [Leptolyngbya sp. FACHB-36]MBD2019203.1 hypothetical protein [Leptolyngbya sp. FACHB-36]